MPHFLGVDIGTTNLKAVLVDERQLILAASSRPLRILRPQDRWSEQEPRAWWTAFLWICAELRRQAPKRWQDIAAIGLTGQMHAALCLDSHDRPLRPAILWNDGRAQAECADLMRAVPDVREITGVAPMAGFTAPKLLWLRRHEPHVFERIARVLFPKDFIRLKLSGEHVTDMSEGAGSLMLDEAARQWSQRMLTASGLALNQLPRLVEGPDVAGTLTPSIAGKLGLHRNVIVAAGGGDAAAGAAGIGVINEGDSFISLGTSGQYFIAREHYRLGRDPTVHSFAHCLPGRWYDMAALLNGASCLEWISRLLRLNVHSALAEAEADFRQPSPVLFLPYLAGERTPHDNPNLRALFSGLGHATGRRQLIQAVLEGVALSFADVEARLPSAASLPLAVVGGGARSLLWMQILADVLGKELVLFEGSDTAAPFGAARLARLAFTNEPVDLICTKPKISRRIAPRSAWHEQYMRKLECFRQAFPISQLRPTD
jgi:xylulokinase